MQKIELNELTRANRKPWSWTNTNESRAKDILSVFNELKRYLPLTERQVYYRLISSNMVKQDHWFRHNNPEKGRVDVYSAIGRLLKWMRIDDRLPWDAIQDEHRILSGKVGFTDPKEFIEYEVDDFLEGYQRCLAHRQDNYIEVWIEKAALYHIVKPVVDSFCRRLLCCKGYNSVSFQADFYHRASEALNMGQKPIVLYFGDWDPSGVNMLYAAAQTLIDELGLVETEFYRCGINPEHFHLIEADPVPIKPTDSRAKKFIEQNGDIAYELDAFHPETLKTLVRLSIQEFTDMEAVQEDQEKSVRDERILSCLKADVKSFVNDALQSF